MEKSGSWKSFISQSIQIQPYEGIFLSGSAAGDIFTAGVPSFSILDIPLGGTTMMKSVLDLVFCSCDCKPANIAIMGTG